MTGKITVLADNGQRSNVAARTITNNAAADTVGVLMVPAEDSQDIVQSLRTAGFGIDSMTTFRVLLKTDSRSIPVPMRSFLKYYYDIFFLHP